MTCEKHPRMLVTEAMLTLGTSRMPIQLFALDQHTAS